MNLNPVNLRDHEGHTLGLTTRSTRISSAKLKFSGVDDVILLVSDRGTLLDMEDRGFTCFDCREELDLADIPLTRLLTPEEYSYE